MQLALDLAALLASIACLVQNPPHPLARACAAASLGTVAPILPLAISAVATGLTLLRHLKQGPDLIQRLWKRLVRGWEKFLLALANSSAWACLGPA